MRPLLPDIVFVLSVLFLAYICTWQAQMCSPPFYLSEKQQQSIC